MQLTPYLGFNGNCGEAMKFYESVLGGKLEKLVTMGDIPGGAEQACSGDAGKIMHACLVVDGVLLMAGDAPSHVPYDGMKGFHLTLSYPNTPEAERVFRALSDGGTVTMPFEEQFWADRAGMLIDRFGTPWIVNGGVRQV